MFFKNNISLKEIISEGKALTLWKHTVSILPIIKIVTGSLSVISFLRGIFLDILYDFGQLCFANFCLSVPASLEID